MNRFLLISAFLMLNGCASMLVDNPDPRTSNKANEAAEANAQKEAAAAAQRDALVAAENAKIQAAKEKALHIGASYEEFSAQYPEARTTAETTTSRTVSCIARGEPMQVTFTGGRLSAYQVDSNQKSLDVASQQAKAAEAAAEISAANAEREHRYRVMSAIQNGFAPKTISTKCHNDGLGNQVCESH